MATPAPEGLLDRLRAAHDDLRGHLADLAAEAYREDRGYAEGFDAWARRRGLGGADPEERFAVAAGERAHLLVARAIIDARGAARSSEPPAGGGAPLDEEGAVAAFPIDAATRRRVGTLREHLAGLPDGTLEGDIAGALYEAGLPEDERRADGQFYTPGAVAETVVRWALSGCDRPRVLDPGAGAGAFLARAFDRLAERCPDADPLDRLVGVDVNPVPLRIAALRLADRAGAAPADVDVRRSSFFDLDPGDGRFDAVVGNPPYVRAGDLRPSVDHYRRHLGAFGPSGRTPYLDGEARISERADAYAYFVTNATRFLREGGRLGFVLPTKWLSSEYGADLRGFLADRYRIHAVVGLGRAFPEATVDACALFAERRDDPDDGAPVRFVRPDASADVDDLLGAVRSDAAPSGGPTAGEGAVGRTIALPQARTGADADGLDAYLTAPAEALDLLAEPSLVPLGELADVSRGVTTGANRFFFVDDETVERHGIEGRFLRPALKSARGLAERTLDPGGADRRIVDAHGYVERTLRGDERDPAAAVKRALERDGYGGLSGYVCRAEREGWHEGRTCQRRRVWFDLGALPVPDVFLPKLLRERVFVVRNRAGAVPSNAIDCLTALEGVDPLALVGVLESSLVKAIMELWGRDEAGMLQLMTAETGSLPVPDVRGFEADDRERVTAAARRLLEGKDARAELDAAVLEAAGIDRAGARVRELRARLLERRVERGSAGGGSP